MQTIQFPPPFPFPKKTRSLVFCDFDETYFAHECTAKQRKDIQQLEDFLQEASQQYGFQIGWITGSDTCHLLSKVKQAGMRFSPHFICSNLGTDVFHVLIDGKIESNKLWEKSLPNRIEFHRMSAEVVSELKNMYQIELVSQSQYGQSAYKKNYYYFIRSSSLTAYHMNVIKQVASLYGVGLNINRCNPKAGDPTYAYDVDFVPKEASGKDAVAAFMCQWFNVHVDDTLAFGDSGNDIKLLKFVKHGYLVGNATSEAQKKHNQMTNGSYTEGILEMLKKHYT
ncbi:HAD-IIB family hydrolase [Shouchella miscanthi]|uniref:HAD-IIB family hydrolase n=1 Tax=Shouchella miscanthi TaxID=2598861 RepID=UPI0011A9F80D|nr:HAD-IIB family hydrolase [Shouchella miscanthi]